GLGINWASSLELALRVISWLWAWHLCAESVTLSPRFVTRLLEHLIAHGCHIESYLSHFFSPNTHLTGEALGMFYLGASVPELRRAVRWRRIGFRVLMEQLFSQVRDDGMHFEQSSYYQRYTADYYLHLWILARECRISLPDPAEARV